MKRFLPLGIYCLVGAMLFLGFERGEAQLLGPQTNPWRSATQVDLAPFYHGVASGDPTQDGVMLWTRVTTDSLEARVKWRMALDTAMTQMVDSGWVLTDGGRDYTVKVDVGNLQANTFYFYEFEYEDKYSIRGRTRTLPSGSIDSLRFGVVSCSNYDHGYFNAYARLLARNDLDLIIHLGDYIYEYGNGQYGNERRSEPPTEILDLGDYRMRHSHYKLDEDLMRLHQQYPFVSVWDDHESADNAWVGGANNHSPSTEGDWLDRKSAAIRAYFEWMPLRQPDPNGDSTRIYRRFRLGDLVELHMLDTRLQARDEQSTTNRNSSSRTLLGQGQFDWLVNGMDSSTAQWQIIGQQVMMAPLNLNPLPFGSGIFPNSDQWDGYAFERGRLYDSVQARGINNMVILTGDIHTAWANDLPLSGYQSSTGANSIGVEFVTTAITSASLPLPVSLNIVRSANPHVKYVDLTRKGYYVLDINQQRTQADYYTVARVNQVDSNESLQASWQVLAGERFLRQASGASVVNPNRVGVLAPLWPRERPTGPVVGLERYESVWLGIYPNPSLDWISLQFSLVEAGDVRLTCLDMQGRVLETWNWSDLGLGLHRRYLRLGDWPSGSYVLRLELPNAISKTRLIQKR